VPASLHYTNDTPVAGLVIAERWVPEPEATLICVHGGLDRGASFGRLARRLETFDVVAYDRRGYQNSRDLGPLSLERHIDDLIAITRHEPQCGPVLFFGHSYGGVVALGTAVAEPMLSQLVLVYETPLSWILARQSSRPPLTTDAAHEVENFFKRMVSRGTWERLSETERESRRLDGPGLMSDLSILTPRPPFEISQLATACVYVHGDRTLAEYYRALSAELTRINPVISSCELPNVGHGAHLSSPDRLASLIHNLWEQRCASV
jgi:pimeloyl-ACP methyl ester carboxylesterase